jgi:hypothetical protein
MPSTPRNRIKDILYGFRASQCLHAAAGLGLADFLADGHAMTSHELAGLTSTDPAALQRLLLALVGLEILREAGNDRFALAPDGEFLRKGIDGSLRDEILHMLHPTSWEAWGDLLGSVVSGEAAFPRAFGKNVWEYRAEHQDVRAIFDAMSTACSRWEANIILKHLTLPETAVIVDVGGGNGALLIEILLRKPGTKGLLFEQPEVLSDAGRTLVSAGLTERCRIVAGDFFQHVPPGGELYFLKAIIHNWNDDDAMVILRNCRRSMSDRSRIVVVESLADPDRPPCSDLMDLHMLVMHGGRERTAAEHETLLRASGFRVSGIWKGDENDRGTAIIEALPV